MKTIKLLATLTLAISTYGQQPDTTVLQRIRDAALSNSDVMEQAFWLSDVYGPRLTGSPNFRAAGTWAEARLREYGVQVHEEPIHQFGDGWWCDHFEMSLLTPTFAPILAAPVAWSNATSGRVVGEVVRVTMPRLPSEFDSFVANTTPKYVILCSWLNLRGLCLSNREFRANAFPTRILQNFRATGSKLLMRAGNPRDHRVLGNGLKTIGRIFY